MTSSQYEAYLGIDLRLQEVILEALGDSLLGRVLSLVVNHSLQTRSFAEASAEPSKGKVPYNIDREHLTIVGALLDEDSEKVQEAVKWHLNNAGERTIQAMNDLVKAMVQNGTEKPKTNETKI